MSKNCSERKIIYFSELKQDDVNVKDDVNDDDDNVDDDIDDAYVGRPKKNWILVSCLF